MVWSTGDKLHRDKYKVERELGRGRRSITYLVKDNHNCRWVVKRLNEALLNPLAPNERNRLETKFSQEAMKLSGFNHPNIVKVREFFKEGEEWCIVMEYVDGVNLAERAQNILPENEALGYIQ